VKLTMFHVPLSGLDVDLCAFSGQMFRWIRTPDGIEGRDGSNGYRIRYWMGSYMVETTADQPAFERLFRLDEDLATRLATQHPNMAPLVQKYPGLRWMRPSCRREVFFGFMCSSNNNLPRIQGLVRKLGELENYNFPTLEQLCSYEPPLLRMQGFGYRAPQIYSAAQELRRRGGDDYLDELATQPYEAQISALLTFPGVGPKIADCIALYGFQNGLAVPFDTHMWRAATRLYRPDWADRAPTAKQYRAMGDVMREEFGELAGLAHLYLFFDEMDTFRARSAVK